MQRPWPIRMWVVLAVALLAHRPAVHAHDHGGSTFTENRGQWPAQVLYRVLVPDGAVFVEADGLTVVQYADLPLQAHGGGTPPSGPPRAHAYRVKFVDGSAQAHTGELTAAHYENHFIGRDPAGWGHSMRRARRRAAARGVARHRHPLPRRPRPQVRCAGGPWRRSRPGAPALRGARPAGADGRRGARGPFHRDRGGGQPGGFPC